MGETNVAIIVAAGRGTRLGASLPKAFLPLRGEPLVIRALRPFEACEDVHRLLVVVPESERERALELMHVARLSKLAAVISGGEERSHSVARALEVLSRDQVDLILVHDGARPLVTPAEIARVIEKARQTGAALLALPISETVKEVEGERVLRTVDRRRLYLAQTPQAFRADILREAYARAMREGIVAPDDAALVERCGWPVWIVRGSTRNLKITWPEDLLLAEALLRVMEGG